jgi:hypothetical protein
VLQALDESPTDKFVVLFRKDLNLKFRALYSGTVIRISATIRIICAFSRKDLKLKLYTLYSPGCPLQRTNCADGAWCRVHANLRLFFHAEMEGRGEGFSGNEWPLQLRASR